MARIVAWSPDVQRNQFTCYTSSKSALELYSINEDRNGSRTSSLIAQRAVSNLVCMEWSKAGISGSSGDIGNSIDSDNIQDMNFSRNNYQGAYSNQIVWGNAAGCVTLVDWNNANNECIMCAPPKNGRRSTTSVSWNAHKHHNDRVAAGFDLLKSEYCVNIWDVNSAELLQNGKEVGLKSIIKLCYEEATSSLAWLPDSPHLLAVGTAMGWVRIFDTRQPSSGSNTTASNHNSNNSSSGAAISLEMSLMAHPGARNRKVKGIRPDPFHPYIISTFSDSAQESVKIWDLRKNSSSGTSSSSSKLSAAVTTISPHGGADGQYNPQSSVTDVAWSTSRENVLAVTTSHHKQVLFYSTASKTLGKITSGKSIQRGSVSTSGSSSVTNSTNSAAIASSNNSSDEMIRTPYHSIPILSGGIIRSLSWQAATGTSNHNVMNMTNNNNKSDKHDTLDDDNNTTKEIPGSRLIVGTSIGVTDLLVVEGVALDVSVGGIGAGSGRDVCFSPPTIYVGASNKETTNALKSTSSVKHNDISDIPTQEQSNTSKSGVDTSINNTKYYQHLNIFLRDVERVMCERSSHGYSLDASKNMQVLSDELDSYCNAKRYEYMQKISSMYHSPINNPINGNNTTSIGEETVNKMVNLDRQYSNNSVTTNGDQPNPASMNGSHMYNDLHNRNNIKTASNAMDTSRNDHIAISSLKSPEETQWVHSTHELFRVWMFIERVESLHDPDCDVTNSGVLSIVKSYAHTQMVSKRNPIDVNDTSIGSGSNLSHSISSDLCTTIQHPLYNIPVYSRSGTSNGSTEPSMRERARQVCGWASDFATHAHKFSQNNNISLNAEVLDEGGVSDHENGPAAPKSHATGVSSDIHDANMKDGSNSDLELYEILEEYESLDSFERAAALALWHGDTEMSISILQKHADNGIIRFTGSSGGGHGWDEYETSEYLNIVTLVAMCISGFSLNNMWIKMCKKVLQELSTCPRISSHYLAAMCHFLLSIATENLMSTNSNNKSYNTTSNSLINSVSSGITASTANDGSLDDGSPFNIGCSEENNNTVPLYPASSNNNNDRNYHIINVPSISIFDKITHNVNLSVEDRAAFASFYLNDNQFLKWCILTSNEYTRCGCIEGIVLTGLQADGIKLCQDYIDKTNDIQTIALLVARTVKGKAPTSPEALHSLYMQSVGTGEGASSNNNPASIGTGINNKDSSIAGSHANADDNNTAVTTTIVEWLWLHEYRSFLNQWQLFIPRALLDVELGRLYRQRTDAHQASNAASVPGSASGMLLGGSMAQRNSTAGRSSTGGNGGPAVDRRGASTRVMYALPTHNNFPHIYLRCNYCSSSLPVDALQQQQHTAFLRKQKPIISFCPNCKKPLPRCYVCQLYMGLVNPHAEVSRILARKRRMLDRAKAAKAAALQLGVGSSPVGNNGNSTAVVVNGASTHTGNNSITNEIISPQLGQQVDNTDVERDDSDHNVLGFGKWLFFCQRCKHGGHASCIDNWFEGDLDMNGNQILRRVCGVNGCDCHCSSL